jgi:hypothetical protein
MTKSPIAILALCAGCATSGPASRFPTRAELERLEQTPPPALSAGGRVDVPRFALAGPLPAEAQLAPHAPSTPWEQLLADAAQARHGLVYVSESMSCVSREAGRYVLENGQLPARSAERFLRARCGVVAPDLALWTSKGTVPADVTDAQVFDHWKGDFAPKITQALSGRGSQLAGIWFGRKGDQAMVLVAVVSRQVELERVPLSAEAGGKVVIRGELLTPAATVDALVNVGAHGFRVCAGTPSVALPRFEVTCEVDPQDKTTWIEVAAFPAGRLVGHLVADLMIAPSGALPDVYERPSYGLFADVAPGTDVASRILTMVNGVRTQASLGPLTLAPAQSATATKVAPHYFAALNGQEPETMADQVVLGLRAGWDVPGVVRYGQFTASLSLQSEDYADLLVNALERPSGRQALLDPAVQVLAVGPVAARDAVAAVLTTYAIMDDAAPAVDAARVLERLGRDRQARGKNAAAVSAQLRDEAARALNDVGRGRLTAKQALDAALGNAVESTHRALRGWVLEVSNPDEISLPDDLLKTPGVVVGVAVKGHRPAGEAWGRYVVLILYASPDGV